MNRRFNLILLGWLSAFASVLGLFSCKPANSVTDVNAALQRYSDCVLRMDSAGIADLFAPDGVVANPGQPNIVGPVAVKKFLDQFKDFKVQAYTIDPKRTSVTGATAEQAGTYRQRVQLPNKKVIEVSGHFRTTWIRTDDGRWLIRRMETIPDPQSRGG